MANVHLKSIEDDKVTDDDLKRHRVGGRLVTRREIARAKKCTKLEFISGVTTNDFNLHSY
jgi:hypothetical protein